jgi:hypothetical protein
MFWNDREKDRERERKREREREREGIKINRITCRDNSAYRSRRMHAVQISLYGGGGWEGGGTAWRDGKKERKKEKNKRKETAKKIEKIKGGKA